MDDFNIDEYDFRMSMLEALKTCFRNGDIKIELEEEHYEYNGYLYLYANHFNVKIDGEIVYSQRLKPIKL